MFYHCGNHWSSQLICTGPHWTRWSPTGDIHSRSLLSLVVPPSSATRDCTRPGAFEAHTQTRSHAPRLDLAAVEAISEMFAETKWIIPIYLTWEKKQQQQQAKWSKTSVTSSRWLIISYRSLRSTLSASQLHHPLVLACHTWGSSSTDGPPPPPLHFVPSLHPWERYEASSLAGSTNRRSQLRCVFSEGKREPLCKWNRSVAHTRSYSPASAWLSPC